MVGHSDFYLHLHADGYGVGDFDDIDGGCVVCGDWNGGYDGLGEQVYGYLKKMGVIKVNVNVIMNCDVKVWYMGLLQQTLFLIDGCLGYDYVGMKKS